MAFRSASFVLPLAAIAAPVLAQPSAELARVEQHLRGVKTMTADFRQTDRNGKVLTGTLTLKQPGRIRFQYEKGVPLLVVADGKGLVYIDYDVKQVSRWPIGNTPLGILLDSRRRDLSGIAKVVPSGEPNVMTVQARDPKHPEYGVITLAFTRDASAPGGIKLDGWVALDAQNNRTTIRLTNQRFNVPVRDEAFRWNDPRTGKPGN